MKLSIKVPLELTKEQVTILAARAKMSGHGYDGTTAPGKLIRRYLTGLVLDAVTYCHEGMDREGIET